MESHGEGLTTPAEGAIGARRAMTRASEVGDATTGASTTSRQEDRRQGMTSPELGPSVCPTYRSPPGELASSTAVGEDDNVVLTIDAG